MFENEVFEGVLSETSTEEQSCSEAEKQVEFNRETGEVTEEDEKDIAVIGVEKKRAKRTESQMIAALGGSVIKEASYVLERVAKLEYKISELMGSISQKSRERVLEERPELSRY